MSDAYVAGKLREALILSKGSRAAAQRLLMVWAASDDKLLRGLAQPFLKAIVGHAVSRTLRGTGGTGGPVASRPSPRRSGGVPGYGTSTALGGKALDRVVDQLSRTMQTGDAGTNPAAKHPSAGHADTIRALADAFRKR